MDNTDSVIVYFIGAIGILIILRRACDWIDIWKSKKSWEEHWRSPVCKINELERAGLITNDEVLNLHEMQHKELIPRLEQLYKARWASNSNKLRGQWAIPGVSGRGYFVCALNTDRDKEEVWHAILPMLGVALCGTRAGWFSAWKYDGARVTCKACATKIENGVSWSAQALLDRRGLGR